MQSIRNCLAVLLLCAEPQSAGPDCSTQPRWGVAVCGGGGVLALRVLICFPALTLVGDEGAAGENNFIGHGLCIKKAGTRTRMQIR